MLVTTNSLLLAVLALSTRLIQTSAFLVRHPIALPVHGTCDSRLAYSEGLNEESSHDNIEQARLAFEEKMVMSTTVFDGIIGGAERLRQQGDRRLRNIEMELIKTLKESDDAVEELIHLWTTERDCGAAADLKMMQTKCSEGLVEEEKRLKEIMSEFPKWAEPCARLAHVFFYQGRSEEARRMAKHTLRLKPWHFEATQLLVSVSIQENDESQAKYWSDLALPPLKGEGASSELREKWVDNAIEQAKKKMTEPERTVGLSAKRGKKLVLMRASTWQ